MPNKTKDITQDIKIFLSHSHSDERVAAIIDGWIDETFNGLIRVFRSSDEGKSIIIGESIKTKIKDELKDSVASIILLSPTSIYKPWINIEFGAAWVLDIHIIPLCLPNLQIKDLPLQFGDIKVCELNNERNCIELLELLLSRLRTKYPAYKLSPKNIEKHGKELYKNINNLLKAEWRPKIVEDAPPPKRITVWLFGSYSGISPEERKLTKRIISIISLGLVKLGVRVVMGESEMLRDFANKYRDDLIASNAPGPNPIILPGKLRQRNLKYLFLDAIGTVPDIAILLGGGVERGRVKEEYNYAIKAGIPVLAIPATGGVAKQFESTVDKASEFYSVLKKTGKSVDVGDLSNAILDVVSKYKSS